MASVTSAIDRAATEPNVTKRCASFRWKRQGDKPGWFDRWDAFGTVVPHPHAIASIANAAVLAAARRQVVKSIALHVSIVAIVSVALIVAGVALIFSGTTLGIVTSASPSGHIFRFGFAALASIELVGLSLVLDAPPARRALFALYTVTLSVLFASTTIAEGAVFAIIALPLIASGWWITWALSGIRICGNFLSWSVLGVIPSLVVSAALVACMVEIPDNQGTALLALGCEVVSRGLGSLELERLVQTLPPDHASMAVYFANLDLLAGGLVQPMLVAAFGVQWLVLSVLRCALWLLRSLVLDPVWFAIDGLVVLAAF